MKNYLKTNPLGNAVFVAYLIPSLLYTYILSTIPEGSDSSGYIWIIYVFPVLALVSGLVSYFIFRPTNEDINLQPVVNNKTETLILIFLTFISLGHIILIGYYSINSGLLPISIIVFPVFLLTRNFSLNKRLLYLFMWVLIAVFILGIKPQNF